MEEQNFQPEMELDWTSIFIQFTLNFFATLMAAIIALLVVKSVKG